MKICLQKLLTEAKNVAENRHKVDEETIAKWRTDIESLSKKISCTKYQNSIIAEVTQSVLGSRATAEEPLSDDALRQTIRQRIDDKVKNFDANTDRDVREITRAARGLEAEMEGDFEVVEKEFTEASAKCPFTQAIMKEPMMNPRTARNNGCKHHVSREGFNSMFTRNSASCDCPIAGCSAKWLKSSAVVDTVFQQKIRDWEQKRAQQQQQQQPQDDSILPLNREFRPADAKCPMTQMTMDEPLKNVGGSGGAKACKHHISRAGLQQLCKASNAAAKCPVPGCVGRWHSSAAVIDKELQALIRKHISSSSSSSSAAGGGGVKGEFGANGAGDDEQDEEDEEDAGYTQV